MLVFHSTFALIFLTILLWSRSDFDWSWKEVYNKVKYTIVIRKFELYNANNISTLI